MKKTLKMKLQFKKSGSGYEQLRNIQCRKTTIENHGKDKDNNFSSPKETNIFCIELSDLNPVQ